MRRQRRCIRAASPQIVRAPRDTHPACSPNCRPRLRRRLQPDYPRYSVDANTLLLIWGGLFRLSNSTALERGGKKNRYDRGMERRTFLQAAAAAPLAFATE